MITSGNNVYRSTKFVTDGIKLTRPNLPQLNLILKSFSIGKWKNKSDSEAYTYINFRFPSAVENRKFKIKIGKVTDSAILQKIQKGDYSGITELLTYAKNNNAIYTKDLVTIRENYFSTNDALFDGNNLLEHKAFYYIYVQFDDENGKYYPIEGVTLGQAWIGNDYWDLWAYTSENIEWNNLSSVDNSKTNSNKDETIAKDLLPNTGTAVILAISILALTGIMVILKIKNDKYKEI